MTRQLLATGAVLLLLACGPATGSLPPDTVVPDFTLADTNPASPTGGLLVQPSRFRGKVSAWYFGSAL